MRGVRRGALARGGRRAREARRGVRGGRGRAARGGVAGARRRGVDGGRNGPGGAGTLDSLGRGDARGGRGRVERDRVERRGGRQPVLPHRAGRRRRLEDARRDARLGAVGGRDGRVRGVARERLAAPRRLRRVPVDRLGRVAVQARQLLLPVLGLEARLLGGAADDARRRANNVAEKVGGVSELALDLVDDVEAAGLRRDVMLMHGLQELLAGRAHRDRDVVVAKPAADAGVRPRDVLGRLVGDLGVVLVKLGLDLRVTTDCSALFRAREPESSAKNHPRTHLLLLLLRIALQHPVLDQPRPHAVLVPASPDGVPRLAVVVGREPLEVVAAERLARRGIDELLLGRPREELGVRPGGPDVRRRVVVCEVARRRSKPRQSPPTGQQRQEAKDASSELTVLLDEPDEVVPLGVLLVLDPVLVEVRAEHALVPRRVRLVAQLPVVGRDERTESAVRCGAARAGEVRQRDTDNGKRRRRCDELGRGLGLVRLDEAARLEPAADRRVGPVLVGCCSEKRRRGPSATETRVFRSG